MFSQHIGISQKEIKFANTFWFKLASKDFEPKKFAVISHTDTQICVICAISTNVAAEARNYTAKVLGREQTKEGKNGWMANEQE